MEWLVLVMKSIYFWRSYGWWSWNGWYLWWKVYIFGGIRSVDWHSGGVNFVLYSITAIHPPKNVSPALNLQQWTIITFIYLSCSEVWRYTAKPHSILRIRILSSPKADSPFSNLLFPYQLPSFMTMLRSFNHGLVSLWWHFFE